MLEAIGLAKTYHPPAGFAFGRNRPAPVHAVRDASFTVAPGKVLGIIGQSGS